MNPSDNSVISHSALAWSLPMVPTAKYSESGCANTRADTDDAGIIDKDSLSSMPVSSATCPKNTHNERAARFAAGRVTQRYEINTSEP